MIHGFTGSPATVEPWARGLAAEGYTVSVPRLAGHGTRWEDLNETQWTTIDKTLDKAIAALRGSKFDAKKGKDSLDSLVKMLTQSTK